jgi:hypothetical protein
MQRRDFLKSTIAVAVAADLGIAEARAKVATSVPAHTWQIASTRKLNEDGSLTLRPNLRTP